MDDEGYVHWLGSKKIERKTWFLSINYGGS
jgi:hypothetical protein